MCKSFQNWLTYSRCIGVGKIFLEYLVVSKSFLATVKLQYYLLVMALTILFPLSVNIKYLLSVKT